LQVVDNLRTRDTAVRAHEAAHQAAAGGLAGAMHLDYQMGPDGKSYAVAGDVPVQLGGGHTPAERLANANRVMRAALAPADPSAQDRSVAAQASALAIEAQRDLSTQGLQKLKEAAGQPHEAADSPAEGAATEASAKGGPPASTADDPAASADGRSRSEAAARTTAARATGTAPGLPLAPGGPSAHTGAGDGCAACAVKVQRYARAGLSAST